MRKKATATAKAYIPFVSINPGSMHLYSKPAEGYNYGQRFYDNTSNLEDNDHAGKISIKAKGKIEKALSWLIFKSKQKRIFDNSTGKSFSFRINFITLTLPSVQRHPDQEIKDRCLNNFLTIARSNGLINYLWRAEAQPQTGNIHFHLTTDKYIHHSDIRKWWNKSLDMLGYIEEFNLKFKHRNPNSVDVHSVKHVKSIVKYLSKYLGKNRAFPCIGELRKIDGHIKELPYNSPEYKSFQANNKPGKLVGHLLGARVRNIEGRLWGCSSSLSKLKSLVFSGEMQSISVFLEFAKQSAFHVVNSEWVSSYYGPVASEAKQYFPELYSKLVEYSS